MLGHALQTVAMVAIAVVLIVAAIGAATTIIVLRALRRRRELRRQEEERRQREERLDGLGSTGVLALAATLEGVRLATQVARVGADLGRSGLAPVLAGSLRRLADEVDVDRPSLRRVLAADGTVTLMFSDIEDSTAINERLGDAGWLELLREHDQVVRRWVRKSRGEVVKTQGDSFMVAFKDIDRAVACAVAVQRGLGGLEADGSPVRVRIGLHHGEVTRQGRDVFGLNVALAARVAAEARGGEILVSTAVRDDAGPESGIHFGRGRRVRLKGISETETLYPVAWEEMELES